MLKSKEEWRQKEKNGTETKKEKTEEELEWHFWNPSSIPSPPDGWRRSRVTFRFRVAAQNIGRPILLPMNRMLPTEWRRFGTWGDLNVEFNYMFCF